MEEIQQMLLNGIEEPTDVEFRGENDTVNAYFTLEEHPPLKVMIGTNYYLDGDLMAHSAQLNRSGYRVLNEGESISETVRLTNFSHVEDGPGPETLTLHLRSI